GPTGNGRGQTRDYLLARIFVLASDDCPDRAAPIATFSAYWGQCEPIYAASPPALALPQRRSASAPRSTRQPRPPWRIDLLRPRRHEGSGAPFSGTEAVDGPIAPVLVRQIDSTWHGSGHHCAGPQLHPGRRHREADCGALHLASGGMGRAARPRAPAGRESRGRPSLIETWS